MDNDKQSFLADLEATLIPARPAVAAIEDRPPRRRSRNRVRSAAASIIFAASTLAGTGSFLLASAAPASASTWTNSTCGTLKPIAQDQWERCKGTGYNTQFYDYKKSTTYYHARTVCSYFNAYRYMCGLATAYPTGSYYACRSY